MEVYMIVSGVVAVILVIFVLCWLSEKKRTNALRELAGSMKFSFS